MKAWRRAFFLICTFALMLVFGASCQKTYSLGPTSPAGSSGTPTATPNYCQTLTPVPGAQNTGIYWGQAFVGFSNNNGTPFYICALYLLVNGNPESTAGVTLIGPSSASPIPYAG